MNDHYVYILFRKDGRPLYVGKGRGRRWLAHGSGRTNHNRHLTAVLKRDGYDVPVVKLREHLTHEEALATEMLFIAAIGREVDGGPLVNATIGGDGVTGLKWSAEACAKAKESAKKRFADPEKLAAHRARVWAHTDKFIRQQRDRQRRRWEDAEYRKKQSVFRQKPMPEKQRQKLIESMNSEEVIAKIRAVHLGRKLTKEHKAKMSAGNRGKVRTPEQRARYSAAKTGVPNGLKDKKLSDAHKAAISAGRRGKPNGWEGKKLTVTHRAKLSAARRLTIARKQGEAEGWGMRA